MRTSFLGITGIDSALIVVFTFDAFMLAAFALMAGISSTGIVVFAGDRFI